MKQAITLLLASGLSFTAFAQEQQPLPQPQEQAQQLNRTEEYLTVSVFGTRKKLEAHLDYGEGEHIETYITAADGKRRHQFPSVIAVMNHLNSQGWEFISFVPDDDGNTKYKRFLMKRKVTLKS